MTKNDKKPPALSLILCSRNDKYMGNSRWRLQTALNYVAEQAEALGRADDIEVLVADWGSDIALRNVLRLTPAAARIVSFMLVPPEIACPLQKDSAFPEVLALNAAARRAMGAYIGRIDQDTLVGRHFLEAFFDLYDGKRQLTVPLDRALLYSNRRTIPYLFAVRSPAQRHVSKFVRMLGRWCRLKTTPNREFWTYFVGIWMIHRDLWTECGGYDERFIHYNWMEVEMILRLRQRYTLIDLGRMVDYDFYHLDHVHWRMPAAHRVVGHKVNTFDLDPAAPPLSYHPNGDVWGLNEHKFETAAGMGAAPLRRESWFDDIAFAGVVANLGLQFLLDVTYFRLIYICMIWVMRAQKAWAAIRREHPRIWPRVLMELWAKRGVKKP